MNLCLRRFTLTTSAIVLLTLTGWLDANAFQQRERLVLTRAWPIEPVKIVAIKTKNKARVERGKPFNEEDDWLDGLTLTLANNSAKTVTALSIELVFTEDGSPLPPWSWDLNFGPSPNSPEYLRRDTNKVIKIGQTVELGLSKERYQGLREGLKQSGNTRTITQLEIEVREVGFADGSMVQEGRLYLQDPAHPTDPTRKINTRYQGKPLLIVLENYVLHTVGALNPERYQAMQQIVQRVFGGGADWKQTMRNALRLEESLDEELRTLWQKDRDSNRARGLVLHPAQFAEMVVDKNFAPLLKQAAQQKRP